MTLEQYQQRLTAVAQTVAERATDAAIVPAASALLAKIKNRIIVDGKNSAGAKIGNYSTKPGYYSKDQFVKKGAFRPQGQRGFTGERIVSTKTFRAVRQKNGTERIVSEKQFKVVKRKPKTMFLESGYSQLRSIQGRENGFVNAEYSGDTFLALQMVKGDVSVKIGFTRERAAKIRTYLEQRYGQIYTGTAKEQNEYKLEVSTQLERITRQLLSA